MKKKLCFILVLVITFSLLACSHIQSSEKDVIRFYYRRADYQYNSSENVIVPEAREVAGHTEDLSYVLSLYLMGPLDDDLVSPFPAGIRLFRVSQEDSGVEIILSSTDDTLSESAFSLACACISMTCMDLTGEDIITIISGERTITVSSDSILLNDTYAQNQNTTEELP